MFIRISLMAGCIWIKEQLLLNRQLGWLVFLSRSDPLNHSLKGRSLIQPCVSSPAATTSHQEWRWLRMFGINIPEVTGNFRKFFMKSYWFVGRERPEPKQQSGKAELFGSSIELLSDLFVVFIWILGGDFKNWSKIFDVQWCSSLCWGDCHVWLIFVLIGLKPPTRNS